MPHPRKHRERRRPGVEASSVRPAEKSASVISPVAFAIALVGFVILTFAPTAYRWSLASREPADFVGLSQRLSEIELAPPGWTAQPAAFDLTEEWTERLGMKLHRSEEMVDGEGRRMHVLMMLSETGEQLMHTPDVCYAAVGCEIQGDVVSLPLERAGGDIRVVGIQFDRLTESDNRVVAYGYWAEGEWTSPSPARINNQLGRQLYLLKFQILIDRERADDQELTGELDDYLQFLGSQLAERGV